MTEITKFFNAKCLKNGALTDGEVWIQDGIIVKPQNKADKEVDVQGNILAPGYIDAQINGGFGIDLLESPSKVEELAKHLPKIGVTSFLPTLISAEPELYKRAIPCLQPRCVEEGAEILGIHLEGPFLNPEQSGAHNRSALHECTNKEILYQVYGKLSGVKLITLAPELPGALLFIQTLAKRGIKVSIGHSQASAEVVEQAIDAGATLATHVFNAMSGLHHRYPGIVGKVLGEEALFFSIIADTIHVDPLVLKLAWKANKEKLFLVSDAMMALGLEEGHYHLGQHAVEITNGKVFLAETNTVAGSTLGLDAAVRNFHKATGCTIGEALETASTKPARALGIESIKGSLKLGCDADLIILNDLLEIKHTYVKGKLVWTTGVQSLIAP